MSQHQPGTLKQSNKKHKGSSSNRQLKRQLGPGRVAKSQLQAGRHVVAEHKNSSKYSKEARRNHALQVRNNKRAESWLQRRLGSTYGPPRIACLISLSDAADTVVAMRSLISRGDVTANGCTAITDTTDSPEQSLLYVSYPQFHSHFAFVRSPVSDLLGCIDSARVTDIIVLVLKYSTDVSTLISQDAARYMKALKALGCPEVICVVQGLKGARPTPKAALKDLEKYLMTVLSVPLTAMDADQPDVICRQLSSTSVKDVSWRSNRSYVVADSVSVDRIDSSSNDQVNDTTETHVIRVRGYVRGCPMYIHSLGHLPGVGSCRVSQVHVSSASRRTDSRDGSNAGADTQVYKANPEEQEPMTLFAQGDALAGEQTWPSEVELTTAGQGSLVDGRNRRNVPKYIPGGMSAYQADWFLDEEGQFDTGAAAGLPQNQLGLDEEPPAHEWAEDGQDDDMQDGMSMGDSLIDGQPGNSLSQLDDKRLRRQALEDRAFPDEVDTPCEVSARVRFARYRALQSFRSSPWHPKENLPPSYSRIFQFEDFSGTQRRAISERRQVESLQNSSELQALAARRRKLRARKDTLSRVEYENDDMMSLVQKGFEDDDNEGDDNMEGEETAEGDDVIGTDEKYVDGSNPNFRSRSLSRSIEGETLTHTLGAASVSTVPGAEDYVCLGSYVTLELCVNLNAVDGDTLEKLTCGQSKLLTWFSLLRHEHKVSVLNFTLERVDAAPGDETAVPIKSKQDLIFMAGFRSFVAKPVYSEANLNCDKHKLERFLVPGHYSVATVFGPVTYQPCPLLVLRRTEEGNLEILAAGSLLSVDPDRIVLKKVILTGLPIRVRKKFAVVKHLFYDSQDVRWFQPAELVTKYGLRGKIREPVGTHGLLKAGFSAPVKQNDTVMLVLYKRVFPKFPEEGIRIS